MTVRTAGRCLFALWLAPGLLAAQLPGAQAAIGHQDFGSSYEFVDGEDEIIFRSPRMEARFDAEGVTFCRPGGSGSPDQTLVMKLHGAGNLKLRASRRSLPQDYFIYDSHAGSERSTRFLDRVEYVSEVSGLHWVFRESRDPLSLDLEYDVIVPAGLNLDAIVISCDGRMQIQSDGSLSVMQKSGAVLIEKAPIAWQGEGAQMSFTPVEFILLGEGRYGFRAPARDLARSLTIDPVVEWSTYLGGEDAERMSSLVRRDDGNIVAVGSTQSGNFHLGEAGGDEDFVLAIYDADDGMLASCWVLGGSGLDRALAVIMDGDHPVVVGHTTSPDFPVTPDAWQSELNGSSDAFLARFSRDGTTLLFATYIGGQGDENLTSITAVGESVFVAAGNTSSDDLFATGDALQPGHGGGDTDLFLLRFEFELENDTPLLNYASYFGGSGEEWLPEGDAERAVLRDASPSIKSDATGKIYLSGTSTSNDIPGLFDITRTGRDKFNVLCAVFDLNLSPDEQIRYAASIGGREDDIATSLEVMDDGRISLAGGTWSRNFPLTLSIHNTQPPHRGASDVFLAVLKPNAEESDIDQLKYSTILGFSEDDVAMDLAVDKFGRILVAGYTESRFFPDTGNALDRELGGTRDAFFTLIEPNSQVDKADQFLYTSFFGGEGADTLTSFIRLNDGELLAVGHSDSNDFPQSVGRVVPLLQGSSDAFLVDLSCAFPRADFSISPVVSGEGEQLVHLDASISSSPTGTKITDYSWSIAGVDEAPGVTADIFLPDAGRFSIELRVTNDVGLSHHARQDYFVACRQQVIDLWRPADIGPPRPSGGILLQAGDCFEVCGGGRGFGRDEDNLHYEYRRVVGDASVTAMISESSGGSGLSPAGLQFRENLASGSVHAGMYIISLSGNQVRRGFFMRTGDGNPATQFIQPQRIDLPVWLRMERAGDEFIGWTSLDGETWEEFHRETITMPSTLHLGMSVTSRDESQIGTVHAKRVLFCDVELRGTEPSRAFRRGDSDGSSAENIGDAITVLAFLFLGDEGPSCLRSADSNRSDSVDLSDPVYLLNFLFLGGSPPPPPHNVCGFDDQATLACDSYPLCR